MPHISKLVRIVGATVYATGFVKKWLWEFVESGLVHI